jgi:two-component system response regulator LytT
MQIIKTIILEDEAAQQKQTEEFLQKFSAENGNVSFDVSAFSAPMEFLETYRYDADLIFLDIRMPGISGMDVAKEIRKNDSGVTIVFITSLAQYAIEGYSVQAEDYILKPLKYSEFKLKMTRIIPKIDSSSGKTITFASEKGIFKLNSDDITFIETMRHNLDYHTNDKKVYRRHLSMRECEKELEDYHFLRINQAYLVNLAYADSIVKGSMILKSGEELKISRPRMSSVLKTFEEYSK